MGIGCPGGMKSCASNLLNEDAIAPNPNPSNWTLLNKVCFGNAYVLKVKYNGCTNYEGVKVMVFEGIYPKCGFDKLDPHFSETSLSPIARFKPTDKGWRMACYLAAQY